jgi:NADPH:quinone reductase-like Zn-dependent oxidoreductase
VPGLALVSRAMFAVSAARFDPQNPISGLELGEHAEPVVPDGWTTVRVKAAALNHHDVWSLRGVGLAAERLPMILGCDAAGLDEDGREVVVHAVVGDALAAGGDETLDPSRTLLSENTRARWPSWSRFRGATSFPSPRTCPSSRLPACRRRT